MPGLYLIRIICRAMNPTFLGMNMRSLSIQAAEENGDDEEKAFLTKFWNSYLPFAYSLKNGYSYLAIGVSGENKGKIIYGQEPVFEDFSIEADSFEELLDSFTLTLTSNKESIKLLEFI